MPALVSALGVSLALLVPLAAGADGGAPADPPHGHAHVHAQNAKMDEHAHHDAHGAFMDRPDSHAPIGVMGDHPHHRGEWMLSYRYTRMRMDGNRDRTNRRSTGRVLRDYPVAPTDMDVDVHMIGVMFAPTERITLTTMVPILDKSMDHRRRDGVEFQTDASGIGDIKVGSLVKLWRNENHRVHLNGTVSIPVGTTGRKDNLPPPAGRQRLPYPMQLGSGTWDFITGATYIGHSSKWSWGAQALGTIRTDDNGKGYRLGNRVDATAWLARPLTDFLSLSLRAHGMWWDDVNSEDKALNKNVVPTADPNRRGGHRIDLLGGLNLMLPLGGKVDRYSHRIAIEGGGPVYQWLRGPQLETDYRITVGWQKSFAAFSFGPLW